MKPRKRMTELGRVANIAEKLPGGEKVNGKQVVARQWSERPSVLKGAQKGLGWRKRSVPNNCTAGMEEESSDVETAAGRWAVSFRQARCQVGSERR